MAKMFSTAIALVEDKHSITELKEVFCLIDTDQSGHITCDEFYELLCMVGMGDQISRDESEKMVAEVDEDGTGGIEFGEYLKVMRKKPKHTYSKQEVLKAFEELCLGR